MASRLAGRCRDHALMGEWRGHRDCYIKPDLILIYRIIVFIVLQHSSIKTPHHLLEERLSFLQYLWRQIVRVCS